MKIDGFCMAQTFYNSLGSYSLILESALHVGRSRGLDPDRDLRLLPNLSD